MNANEKAKPFAEAARDLLDESYRAVVEALEIESPPKVFEEGERLLALATELAQVRHAARGVALTLAVVKSCTPEQDIRLHKAEFAGGFSARAVDTQVVVPFLNNKGLYANVETHWLSQTFSFAATYARDTKLKTQPKVAGPLMLEVVNGLQEDQRPELARQVIAVILRGLVLERNAGRVLLTRPKNWTISQVCALLDHLFAGSYKSNAPRLPQLAMYALYQCLLDGATRYSKFQLEPLMRMKKADRKAGTVGDVVVLDNGRPIEAVETKLGVNINAEHIGQVIQKIRAASVERYLVLSTVPVDEEQYDGIDRLINECRRANGCEIIVNGVAETIRYSLRLLPNTLVYVDRLATLLESDPDLGYEHRVAWNSLCEKCN